MTIGFSSYMLKYFPLMTDSSWLFWSCPADTSKYNKDTTESEQAPSCLPNHTSHHVNTSQLYNFVLYSSKVFPVKWDIVIQIQDRLACGLSWRHLGKCNIMWSCWEMLKSCYFEMLFPRPHHFFIKHLRTTSARLTCFLGACLEKSHFTQVFSINLCFQMYESSNKLMQSEGKTLSRPSSTCCFQMYCAGAFWKPTSHIFGR